MARTATMRRFFSPGSPLTAAAACLLLQGCAAGGAPAVPLEFGGIAEAPAAAIARTGPFDGAYIGAAKLEVNGNFGCPGSRPIGNFRVENNVARLGGFSGTVQPDGNLQMPYGDIWIMGKFDGPRFVGHINEFGSDSGSRFMVRPQNTCIYALELQRTPS